MQKQKLHQKLGTKISFLQIQFLSLLQIPLSDLNSRIQDELEENPALEEEEEINIENASKKDYRYKGNQNNTINEIHNFSVDSESLSDYLKTQLVTLDLNEEERFLAEYLIDSLDKNGWLDRDWFSISDDILVNLNLEFSEKEIQKAISIIQQLDPCGVGARDLKESLIIQLKNKKTTTTIDFAIKILQSHYDKFAKKNFESIIKEFKIEDHQLKEIYEVVEKLNPYPASNFNTSNKPKEYIYPDFLVRLDNDKNIVSLNKRLGRGLRVSRTYQKMLDETKDREAKLFLTKKIESAIWFKEAISQREKTLENVMNTIVSIQLDYFSTGDENLLKPMKLADIAEIVKMDLSTISRVTNSKYVETFFGTFLLKDLFSEAYRKEDGEKISVKVIKKSLEEIIRKEDKKSPFTDEKISELLGKEEYHIARRTVAKYREELKIPTSKYRRKL